MIKTKASEAACKTSCENLEGTINTKLNAAGKAALELQ